MLYELLHYLVAGVTGVLLGFNQALQYIYVLQRTQSHWFLILGFSSEDKNKPETLWWSVGMQSFVSCKVEDTKPMEPQCCGLPTCLASLRVDLSAVPGKWELPKGTGYLAELLAISYRQYLIPPTVLLGLNVPYSEKTSHQPAQSDVHQLWDWLVWTQRPLPAIMGTSIKGQSLCSVSGLSHWRKSPIQLKHIFCLLS